MRQQSRRAVGTQPNLTEDIGYVDIMRSCSHVPQNSIYLCSILTRWRTYGTPVKSELRFVTRHSSRWDGEGRSLVLGSWFPSRNQHGCNPTTFHRTTGSKAFYSNAFFPFLLTYLLTHLS